MMTAGAIRGVFGVAILVSVLATSSSRAYPDADREDDGRELVCYSWDIFVEERFRLDVRRHSRLSTPHEERASGDARQTVFSAHGKHVIFDIMAVVNGTVVVARSTSAKNRDASTGAHMSLHSVLVRGDGVVDFARPVTVECTSAEDDPTPAVWSCQSRNDFDVYHGFSTLTKVDARKDERCGVFEDGTFGQFGLRSAAGTIRGPASILKK